MTTQLTASVVSIRDCAVITLTGQAGPATAGHTRVLLAAQTRADYNRVVLDLSLVAFMDPGEAEMLRDAQQDLMAHGRTMALACPQPVVARLLTITGTDQWIPVYGSVGAAVAGHLVAQ